MSIAVPETFTSGAPILPAWSGTPWRDPPPYTGGDPEEREEPTH
jgi:hypothetical protein